MEKSIITAKATKENTNSFIGLENRKKINITGVSEVVSTNENNITGKLGSTKFIVAGKNIQITKLDIEQGVVEAVGLFDSVKFGQASSFVKRLFS